MEVLNKLQSFYLRKQRIEISIKLPPQAVQVKCTILDGHGNDITNNEGVLYSKANILHVQKIGNCDTCVLYLNFMRARRLVSMKLTAFDSKGAVMDETIHSCRIYSQRPKALAPEPGSKRAKSS